MWVSADASAPASMSSFDSALAPRAADKCSGVSPYSVSSFTLAPAARSTWSSVQGSGFRVQGSGFRV